VREFPITVRDFQLADTLLYLTLVTGHAVNEGRVSKSDAKAWLQDLQARNRAGRFFATRIMFVVTGKKSRH